MRPRLGQTTRIREPRIDPQPTPHERDDERLIQPVELPDDDNDSDDGDPAEDQPAEPDGVRAMPLRDRGRPATTSQSPASRRRQVRFRDTEQPIAPPDDADERDGNWSAMNWKKSVKELCDPVVNIVK